MNVTSHVNGNVTILHTLMLHKICSATPTLYADVLLCLGMILSANSVDLRVQWCILLLFIPGVTYTSRAVMCISMKRRKNVTNHRGQSQNEVWFRMDMSHMRRIEPFHFASLHS